MKDIYYFTKKELLEVWRTKRLLILLVVFIIFGILSPLMAKLTPEILKSSFGSEVQLTIPEPTSIDSWIQFYKNITQMGIYILVILYSNSVSGEVSRGSLTNLVTKGLNRSAVITSKYLVIAMQGVLAVCLSFSITAAYTAYYFPDNNSPHIVIALVPLLIFMLFLSALIVFGSAISSNSFAGLLFTITTIALFYLMNLFENISKFNPISLIGENVSILQGETQLNEQYWAMSISLLATIFLFSAAISVMNKKKL